MRSKCWLLVLLVALVACKTGSADISSEQIGGWDGYIHLYQDFFDPNDQLNNLVAGDDDGFGGIGTSDIVDFDFIANTTYFVVTSGFAAGDDGQYVNDIFDNEGNLFLTQTGDTSNTGLFWDRPVAAGPAISGLGPVQYEVQSFTFKAVPEPSSAALLGLAVCGLVARRRR